MLKLIKSQIHLSDKWLLRARTSFPWSRILKDPKAILKALNKVPLVVAGKRGTTWFLALVSFARRSNQIRNSSGLSGLAAYLKTCKLMLMQALADPSRKVAGQLLGKHAVAKTRGGIPRIIPKVHRKYIRKGDAMYIQFWMTLFSLYKVFELKPKYKLHSIYRSGVPESALEATGLFQGIDHFRKILFSKNRTLAKHSKRSDLNHVREPKWIFEPLPILMKVTPNTLKGEIAFFNIIRDAKVWVRHPLFSLLKVFVQDVEHFYNWSHCKGERDGSYTKALQMLERMGEGELFSLGGKRVQARVLDEEMKKVPDPIHSSREVLMDFMTQIANLDLTKENLDPTRLWLSLAQPKKVEEDSIVPLYDSIVTRENFPRPTTESAESVIQRKTKDHKPLPQVGALGRLGLKLEPSGKVRVFAMVDWWTQSFMSPIHKWLFKILRTIREDATFDQESAVQRFSELVKTRSIKNVYSFDLSAATDRLPLLVQIKLLGSFISERTATLWAALLVARGYKVPRRAWPYLPKGTLRNQYPSLFSSFTYKTQVMDYASERDINHLFSQKEVNEKYLFYKVGAPMGCLSNWAMLALTHHYLVQFAAKEVGYDQWFDEYLVLGDDIVIGNEKVASEYQELMGRIGVPINKSKSLFSNNGSFEFASQFIYKGVHNCSPFSMDEINVAMSSLPGLVLLFQKLRRHPKITLSSVLQFMGFGYKARSVSTRNIQYLIKIKAWRLVHALALLLMPGVSPWSKPSYSEWLRSTSVAGPSTNKSLDTAKKLLFEKEITPFFSTLSSKDFIAWDKVFIKTPTSDSEKSLFTELISPLLDKWTETRTEALGSLFNNSISDPDLDFEQSMSRYLDASSELTKTPCDLRWESLQETSFRPNVGRWLRLWLRLWTAVHSPNWFPRNQSIKESRLSNSK